uniref:armadillo repeat-containing protein 3 isoform X1 n=1 Tax=Ciona intestinalis TaxID=7719 RepID=UPI00089DB066|nr:armadillo repeat-containing protein 3 isoform X1 [Ciona intestinalis]|eukprot:XP_018668995.1 armadillo repeat-containing protein 3 isoform X1 [Ciona intestinalis]
MGKKVKKEVEAPPKDVFDPLNFESKKTGTVVLMLKSDEEEVLAKACEAIYRFADKCEENKLMLLELGAMESLIRLINHEEKMVKRYACMAFGVMAGHADVRRYLRKTDAIPSAIQLLGDEDDVCNEFASLFLSHMSGDFSSKLSIGQSEGVEPLINLLASPDPDVQKNSLQAICNLVQDFQSRTAVRELGGIPSLLESLKSEYAVIQGLGLSTLASVTQDGESRAVVRENEGLELLVDFLGNKDYDDLHVHALSVLSNCLEDTESLDDIRSTGGLESLLSFATEASTSPEVQANTARALSRAAKNVENGKILHEQEAEKTLITMTGSESDIVRIAACQAIATLSNNLAAKDAFGKSEGIPPLINLLSAENPMVREAATLALANLTLTNTNNANEVLTSGGVEQLLSLLQFNKESVVINSAACLINMAQDLTIRNDIFKRGIVASLTEPLKSKSPRVQSKIAQAVSTFVTGAEARSEICQHGGLEPLVQLVKSGDADVRRNASCALLLCCADPPTAAAISKLGGLEILQEINSSEQRCNNFSVAAFEKLLDSNLPAKYSLTGRLASHNIITDGFYDAGQLRPESKFFTLDEISKQEVNQKRPILLVNCKATDVEEEELEGDLDNRPTESQLSMDGTEPGVCSEALNSPAVARSPAPNVKSQDDSSEKGSRVSSKASYTRRKKKDKEALMREEAERIRAEKEAIRLKALQIEQELQKQLASKDGVYHPPVDNVLQSYFDNVTKYILPMPSTREQIVALAQFVVDKMGGEIDRGKMSDFSWELHIAELKYDLKSNIIPIGKIQYGIHYHRALLYKVLADKIGVPCSLVRGEYNRAWNEVTIAASLEKGAARYPPTRYIIDLMHDTGKLIRTDSPEAVQYKSI